MKTETVKINNVEYTIKELSMEQGLSVLNIKTGEPDIGKIVSMSVSVGGHPVVLSEIPLRDGMQLIPSLLKINGLDAPSGEEGNA
jgi:hypothetical protein